MLIQTLTRTDLIARSNLIVFGLLVIVEVLMGLLLLHLLELFRSDSWLVLDFGVLGL